MNWVIAIAAFLAALGLLLAGAKLAHRLDITDRPGGRKQHDGAVPLIGGLAIMPVFIAGVCAIGYGDETWPLLLGVAALLIVGALDDIFFVKAWTKFLVQISVACFVVIMSPAALINLGNLLTFGDVYLGFLAAPFAVICLVLMMNAINMIDGLDGLSGGLSAITLCWLMMVCGYAGYAPALSIMACLLAPLLAFLVLNMRHPWRQKASVFLGDAGSLTLGLVLGWLCIILSQMPTDIIPPMSAAWIIALPIMDALALFMLRVFKGRHPFAPDRNHLHHHLVDNGITAERSVAIILFIHILFGGFGFLAFVLNLPEALLFFLWVALYALHLTMTFRPSMWISALKTLRQA